MKKYLCICISFFLLFIIRNSNYIESKEIIISDNYHFINYDSNISIYQNNIHLTDIIDATLLDAKDDKFIYNSSDSIWLYDLELNIKQMIADNAYNAIFYNDDIIYENDSDNNYLCKAIIEAVNYRNCYKLYLYKVTTGEKKILNLNGNDNYLNDIEGNNLVYTSIHNRDDICNSICSFVNIYDLEKDLNVVLNQYDALVLDMSGNASIEQDIVYFESVPNIYGCNYTQIFVYNINDSSIEMITKENSNCFNDNSEILDVRNGYLLFQSKYGNYENNNYLNYIYSHDDAKYSILDNKCKYENTSIINKQNIICLDEMTIIVYPIDSQAPTINTNTQYSALMENKEQLIKILEYEDNLSSKDNIKVDILSELNIVGVYMIEVELCDRFSNCSLNEILINVIDQDITPPKIYCNDTITIKSNEVLLIEKYGFAIDNVDGKIPIEIISEYDLSKSGTYTLLVKSKDSSGNVAYIEVELIVYDNLKLTNIYFFVLGVCVITIIIIYILRFKKSK